MIGNVRAVRWEHLDGNRVGYILFVLFFFFYHSLNIFHFFFFGRIKRRRMNEWRGKKKIIVSEYVMVLALLMHVSIAEMMSCP